MQLMIKPLKHCQFKCDFCSAYRCCLDDTDLAREKIANVVKQLQPNNVIITGGEPLLLTPSYYESLLNINSQITFSITTNLWDFYLYPEKWKHILQNERIKVITSFQYGDKRRKSDGTPYTENDFIKVLQKFNSEIGYTPSFIAVISNENCKYALDHVNLAKKLGITCKLNSQLPFGKSDEYYPRYELFKLYFKIIDAGLSQYEDNISNFKYGKCPFNLNSQCKQYTRSAIVVNNKVKYSYCEDLLQLGYYVDDMQNIDNIHDMLHTKPITKNCYSCKLYSICNACYVNKYCAKYDKNYCQNMKQIEKNLIQYGFVS